jgi:DNA/RNA-binding domain of Phe-tRNA-synthetase-like protein
VSEEGTFGGQAPVAEVALHTGRVARALRDEFPGLALRYAVVEARPGRSAADVKMRLRYLANRMHGQRALAMRREPIASAYRIFFRHIGLDPDEFRTPIEAAVLERLRAGGFKSQNLIDDALTIATVETGVAMRALDADRTHGQLGLRLAEPDERLGADPDGLELPEDSLVLADQQRALGLIFGETAPEAEVQRGKTERVAVCAIQVGGVPDISVEEAIWTSAGVLRETTR